MQSLLVAPWDAQDVQHNVDAVAVTPGEPIEVRGGKPVIVFCWAMREAVWEWVHALPKAPLAVVLDSRAPTSVRLQWRTRFPHIKLVAGYQHSTHTPHDLDVLFATMQASYWDAYYVETHANSGVDALKMLHFLSRHASRVPLTGYCTGEHGLVTRVAAALMGSHWIMAAKDGEACPECLINRYHVTTQRPGDPLYLLLGAPVSRSVGHILHNHVYAQLGIRAVYVKMEVLPTELKAVMQLCRSLPIGGMSITTPLKKAVCLSIRNQLLQEKAVNTVMATHGRWVGYNTDGPGVMRLIEQYAGRTCHTIAILGAGGAAQAIAHAAHALGHRLVIINRTQSTAVQLASLYQAQADDLHGLTRLSSMGVSVVVNTLPAYERQDEQFSFLSQLTFPLKSLAVEMVYPDLNTPFLNRARACNVRAVVGHQVYVAQAVLQMKHWFALSPEQLAVAQQEMSDYFLTHR